jgi:hypothetical protein
MSTSVMAEFVTLWAMVNGAAVVVLAGLSYFGSIWALEWLASLDRWMYARSYGRSLGAEERNARPSEPEP